jgi:hypothetical protein
MAFQVGNQEADITVEFPNLKPEGDPASPLPIQNEIIDKRPDQPLNDYVDDRLNERSLEEFKRRKEYPNPIDVSPAARGNKIAGMFEPDVSNWRWNDHSAESNAPPQSLQNIPDYSHLAIPDYSHLAPEAPPKSEHYDVAIKQAEELQKNIWTDPQYYPLIKKFMETGDPINAFKAAAAITMLTFGAAPKGSLGTAGGEPPKPTYFKKPANENTPLRSPEVNPVTEAELMSSQVVVQRMQQETQALRQKAIQSGTIQEKGSIVKEMESTLKRLQLDREAHDAAGILSKGDLRELDKEIASVQEMLSVMKSKSGSVVPIDKKQMDTESQQPQTFASGHQMGMLVGGIKLQQHHANFIKDLMKEGKGAGDIVVEFNKRFGVELDRSALQSQITRIKANEKQAVDTIPQEPQAGPRGKANWTPQMQAFIRKIDTITEDGARKRQKELIREFRQRYPDYPGSDATVQSMVSRLRTWGSLNKEDTLFTPDVIRDQRAKSSDTISKPLGQGEFDFNAMPRSDKPIPDAEQAKREMIFARDTYAKFNQSILKGSEPTAQTLEEQRLRGLLYDRTKDLHATVKQLEKDRAGRDVLGLHAREYLEGRIRAYQDFIEDLKNKIYSVQTNVVYFARDAEIRKAILQESASGMVEKGGKQGPVIPMSRNSNPYKEE